MTQEGESFGGRGNPTYSSARNVGLQPFIGNTWQLPEHPRIAALPAAPSSRKVSRSTSVSTGVCVASTDSRQMCSSRVTA